MSNKQRIFKILDIDFKNGLTITILVDKEKVLKIVQGGNNGNSNSN